MNGFKLQVTRRLLRVSPVLLVFLGVYLLDALPLAGPTSAEGAGRQLQDFSISSMVDGPGCGAQSAMRAWGLFIWIPLMLWTLIGVTIVCERYYVSALEVMAQKMEISEDVAGATFMAAGASSPELFIALIGLLYPADDNPGPGTIIGSCIFNVCIIIGVASMTAPGSIIPKWPIFRDMVAGVVSITFMVLFFVFVTTGQINWWQSLIFVLVYSLYVLVMKYNEELGELLYPVAKDGEGRPLLPPSSLLAHATSLSPNSSGSFPVPSGSSKDFPRPGGLTVTHSADQLAQPTSAGRSASLLGAPPSPMSGANPLGKSHSWCHGFQPDDWDVVELGPLLPNRRLTPLPAALYAPLSHERRQSLMFGDVVTKECHPLVEDKKRLSALDMAWILSAGPWELAFEFTVPDCSPPEKHHLYLSAFFSAMGWLLVCTFVMVDSAVKVGACLGMSANVMGLSVLAAGTSVPNALASYYVAQRGKGAMAVCNALGSNVFDILLALGLPWLLRSALNNGQAVPVVAKGVLTYAAILLLTMLVTWLLFVRDRWILRKVVGPVLFAMYFAFMAAALLSEYGYFNLYALEPLHWEEGQLHHRGG